MPEKTILIESPHLTIREVFANASKMLKHYADNFRNSDKYKKADFTNVSISELTNDLKSLNNYVSLSIFLPEIIHLLESAGYIEYIIQNLDVPAGYQDFNEYKIENYIKAVFVFDYPKVRDTLVSVINNIKPVDTAEDIAKALVQSITELALSNDGIVNEFRPAFGLASKPTDITATQEILADSTKYADNNGLAGMAPDRIDSGETGKMTTALRRSLKDYYEQIGEINPSLFALDRGTIDSLMKNPLFLELLQKSFSDADITVSIETFKTLVLDELFPADETNTRLTA